MAAHVDQDQLVLLLEPINIAVAGLHADVAHGAMDKDDGRPFADHLIVDVDTLVARVGHWASFHLACTVAFMLSKC